jgi:hypothetical protein
LVCLDPPFPETSNIIPNKKLFRQDMHMKIPLSSAPIQMKKSHGSLAKNIGDGVYCFS